MLIGAYLLFWATLFAVKLLIVRKKTAAPLIDKPEPVEVNLHPTRVDILRKLSTRKKQAYAALCLAQFCVTKQIRHPDLDWLIEYLLSFLTADNLRTWEECGERLEFNGRDGRCPEDIQALLPADIPVKDFNDFMFEVVEVGLADFYAGDTDQPFQHLLKCIAMMERFGVELPNLDVIVSVQQPAGYGAMGPTVSAEEYQRVIDEFRRIIGWEADDGQE